MIGYDSQGGVRPCCTFLQSESLNEGWQYGGWDVTLKLVNGHYVKSIANRCAYPRGDNVRVGR